MAQTYSTLRREAASGRVYSSQYSSVTAVPPLRRRPVAQAPVAQAPVAQAPVAQAPVAQAPVAQAPVAQAPVAQAPVEQAPAAQAPVAQAPVAQAPVAQAPVAQAPVAQAPAPVAQAPALPAVAPPTAPLQAPVQAPVQAPTSAAAPSTPSPAVLQAAAAIAQTLGLAPAAPYLAQALPAGPAINRTFNLSSSGLPAAAHIAPGGPSGTLTVAGRPDGGHSVTGTVQGVRTLTDPALRPVAWLVHDVMVPHDLSPADLAALPKGSAGTGNQPGAVFTIDGNAPTYTPNCNTVSICISPGSFKLEGDGTWKLDGTIDAGTSLTFHPLVFLGPGALSDMNAPLPSGTAARILTDLFMRPTSVHPELNMRSHFPQRLMAIVRDVLSSSAAPAFLTPDRFTRAAVAIEGLVRSTPRLMPSRETTFLLANQPAAG